VTKTLKLVLSAVSTVISGLILWSIFTVFSLFFMLDMVTPKQLLPTVLPLVAFAWLFLVVALFWWGRKRKQGSNKPRSIRVTRRQLVMVSLAMLITLGVGLGRFFYDKHVDDNLLENAVVDFAIINHGSVSADSQNRTLIELEREKRQLHTQVTASGPLQTVQVHLFATVADYQKFTGWATWSGAYTRCSPRVIEVYLPAEKAGSAFTREAPTSGPAHEMVHVVECQILKERADFVPSWFAEGLAEYESSKGFSKLPDRVMRRVSLWWNRNKMMTEDEFLNYYPSESEPAERVAVFYNSCLEFMRYISARFSEDPCWTILVDVRNGGIFEEEFTSAFGQSPNNLYLEWLKSF